MNKFIEWWARNTVAANLLMVGIFLAGIVGYFSMEREMFPTIRVPGLQIQVAWPGASPLDVEEQVVARIEESVRDLDNIEWVRSFSSEGSGQVFILAEQTVDFTQFMNDVKIRVDGIVSLPRDIEPPRVSQWVTRNEFIRVAVHGDLTERKLKRLAEKLRREAAQLDGVNLVELFGVRREEVSIEVSEEALRRYNLSFSDVAAAIRNNSLNSSSGSVRTNAGAYTIMTRNLADTEQDFASIIVRQTPNGAAIRVGDIATVNDGFEDNEILATLNGEPAVLLNVMTTETMDIVKASESIRKWIDERQATLPNGVKLTLWTDENEAYEGRMATIGSSAGYGLLLVLLVLALTLRPKVAFWVAAGIATAYAGAFVFLPSLGVSINMLSTFAFLLVLGIVVDDAIVVGESIHSESQKTGGGITASVFGTQMVAKPVIFAVLTTIIAFMPWVAVGGTTSEFTRHITWVVITALSFSLIESLIILPAHLSNLKPRQHLGAFGKFQKHIADGITNFAQRRYRVIGLWAVRRRYLTSAIFISIMMVGFALNSIGYIKQGWDPEFEGDEIRVNVTMPEGASYSRALEILAQLQKAEQALVDEVNTSSGGKDKLIENWYTRSRRDSVLAIVKLVPPEDRSLSTKEASIRLRELMGDVPDAKTITVEYQNGNNDPGFELSVRHADLNILREAVAELETKLRSYDALYDVRNNLDGASEEIRLTLIPGAEKLGLTLADVSRQVRQAYFGEQAQRIPREGQDVKVMVRYPKTSRQSIESLKDFRVRTSDGRQVPLMAIAELEYAPGIRRIARWNGNRAARVSADMKENIREDIMKDLEKTFFPDWEKRHPGLNREPIGQAQGQAKFMLEILKLYAVALFIMYMMLAVAFKSYWQPIAIMIAIPFAFVGAFLGHFAADLTLGVFSYFGIAAAAGVVINDNLVLVDYCNKLRDQGMKARKAIIEAGVVRFRPILLTSVTTFVGLVPMMLEQSIQAAFLKPVVAALAGGVLIAFFVTLLFVPALFCIGLDIGEFFRRQIDAIKHAIFGKQTKAPNQAE